jgi:hypothetical protein
MNSIVGKSTGIALLMAAAFLAALFAMGVFSATGVGASQNHVADTSDHMAQLATLMVDEGRDTTSEITNDDDVFPGGFNVVADQSPTGYTVTPTRAATALTFAISADTDSRVSEISVYGTSSSPDTSASTLYMGFDATPANLIELTEITPADGVATNTMALVVDLTKGVVVTKVEITVVDDEPTPARDEEFVGHDPQTYTVNIDHNTDATNSESAGAAVRFNLAADISGEQDEEIAISLAGFGVPSPIDEEHVTINGVEVADVSVSGTTVSIVIPDMDGPAADVADDLAAPVDGEFNTIRISNKAGITNPNIAGLYAIGIDVKDDLDEEGDDAQNVAKVIREIKVDPKSGASGADVTVTGTGFGGASATVFIDTTPAVEDKSDTTVDESADKTYASDDKYDAEDDTNLGSVSITDGKFTLVTDGIVEPDVTPPVGSVYINAIDGNSALVEEGGAAKYSFKASISVDPETASWGETVTITLSDWPSGDNVTHVRFGGTRDGKVAVEAADDEEVEVNVPSGLRTGTLKVEVFVGSALRTATSTIEITPLDLTISPSSVVPGQQITITGSGFEGTKAITSVEVGTTTYTAAEQSTTSGGGATVTVDVPLDVGIGETTVKLTVLERTGEGTITVPKPSISLSPVESLIGSTVQVTGSGFASNGRILLDYGAVTSLQIGKAGADGDVNMSFEVPAGAGIGARTTVKVYVIGSDTIKAETKHSTPGPMLTTTSPVQPGGQMTITGSNFKGFSTLSEIKVGGQNVLPAPAPVTDRQGNFEVQVQVPLLGVGSHTATVADGDANRGTESFSVVATVEVTVTDPAVIFELGDRLIRVWYLERATQVWSFYDPDPDVAAFNTLTDVSSGQNVSIIISSGESVEFQGIPLYQGTNPIALD